MSTFVSYYSPIEQSIKPKAYFQGTQDLMRSKVMHSSVTIKAKNTNYSTQKATHKKSPYMSEFMIIAPWIIAGTALLLSIIA